MNLSIYQIAKILGLEKPGNPADIKLLLTDSRSLEEAEYTLFFAIPTAGNDGHRYIPELYDRGVRNFVVNHIPEQLADADDINWLLVENTISALQKIAARKPEFRGQILAITGSRGKTTLKEWIFQLMEPLSDISRSPRSFNSQIGVPLSMWEINDNTALAIIEAGISHRGEMENLAKCILPDTVILTNIGDAHSEGFNSLSEKASEKILLASQPQTKTIIFCRDYPEITTALSNTDTSGKSLLDWSFVDPDATLFIEASDPLNGTRNIKYKFRDQARSFCAPLEKNTDLENAANAMLFMLSQGVEPEVMEQRFSHLHKIGTRLNVTEGVNGCSLVCDSYTSDFSSLRPALDFINRRRTPDQSATLILSDLHHETSSSSDLYAEIAGLLQHAGIRKFIGVGKNLSANSKFFPKNSLFFPDTETLLSNVSPSDFSNEIILLKGGPEFDFAAIAEMLETRRHETVLEVNLDSIVANYNYFRRQLPRSCGLVCMVKASGYGAGSYEIAKTLQDCGAAYLAVAVLDEGIELREKGISMPIMVMNPKTANYGAMFANRLEPEIYSFRMLGDVIAEARKNNIRNYPIHIKLDTGMHRMGFIEDELPEVMNILAATDTVSIRSAFSHLATADCPDMNDFTELQLERFKRYTDFMLSRSKTPFLRHVLNSAGILRYPQYHYDMARLGIGLYGANTLPPEMEEPLAVVSTLRTIIIATREYQPGESVGYGRRGRITRPTRIATIPIGYADGMNRHFGNGKISVLVNGMPASTVGNICMDACMIDVSGIPCHVGDPVEIFGPNAPLQRLADALDTIPYEILTSISPRVKRIYYRE